MSRYKKELSSMVDTAHVIENYWYYFDKLTAYCINLFDYKGLPKSLPKKEIESNLILTGHCVIFKKDNELVTTLTEPTGFDKYYNPTYTSYAQPRLGSGRVYFNNADIDNMIGRKGVIVYNCDLQDNLLGARADGSLRGFIGRYARLLSDIESTISIRLVNMREDYIPIADNENVKTSIKNFIKARKIGKRSIVVDSSIVPNLKSVDINNSHSTEKIYDLLIARDKIMECFFRELGIKFYQPKKAQVNEEEMNANNSMLLYSIDDFLNERNEGFKRANEMFGTDISVEINPKVFSQLNESEVMNDEEKI